MSKAMTLRLAAEQAADLEAIAQVEGIPVSEAVRQAIEERIRQRRADSAFQKRLTRYKAEHAAALERLSS